MTTNDDQGQKVPGDAPALPSLVKRVNVAIQVSFRKQQEEREISFERRWAAASGSSDAATLAGDALNRAVRQVTDYLRQTKEPVGQLKPTGVLVSILMTYHDKDGTSIGADTAWHSSESDESVHVLARDSLTRAELNARMMIRERLEWSSVG